MTTHLTKRCSIGLGAQNANIFQKKNNKKNKKMRVVSHLAYSPPEPLLCPTSVSTTTAEPERRLRCLREKKYLSSSRVQKNLGVAIFLPRSSFLPQPEVVSRDLARVPRQEDLETAQVRRFLQKCHQTRSSRPECSHDLSRE